MTLLSFLPPEILDLILSLDNQSPAVLALWFTGDSLIQHKISSSVTRICLVNTQEFALCRIPKFLQNLRSLRDLRIIRSGDRLISMNQSRQVLQNLSKTLRTLELDCRDWSFLIASSTPQEDTSPISNAPLHGAEPSSDSEWSLKKAFPVLETLWLGDTENMSLSQIADLPPTLSSLRTSFMLSQADASLFFRSLPRSLTELRVRGQLWVENIKDLPPQLTDLQCKAEQLVLQPQHMIEMPRSLTRMKLNTAVSLSPALLASYPPNLTSISDLSRFDSDHVNETYDFRRALPRLRKMKGTTDFACLPTASIMRSLPNTLVSIHYMINPREMEPKDWPQSLTSLHIRSLRLQGLPCPVFPSTLLALTVEARHGDEHLVSEHISKLPRSLTSLECSVSKMSDQLEFPPTLTRLVLKCEPTLQWTEIVRSSARSLGLGAKKMEPLFSKVNLNSEKDLETLALPISLSTSFPFENLPQSLTHLEFQCAIPASNLKHLPKRLEVLNMGAIIYDKAFDPSKTSEIRVLQDVWSMDRFGERWKEGSERSIPPELLNGQASVYAMMIAMLPRTIQKLRFSAAAMGGLDSKEWFKYLPSFLNSLRIDGTVHEDFVLTAPLKHLELLHLSINTPSDKHVRHFPRCRHAYIVARDGDQLTQDAVIYCPTNVNFKIFGCSWYSSLSNDLQVLRRARLTACDDDGFRKLLSTNPKDFSDSLWSRDTHS